MGLSTSSLLLLASNGSSSGAGLSSRKVVVNTPSSLLGTPSTSAATATITTSASASASTSTGAGRGEEDQQLGRRQRLHVFPALVDVLIVQSVGATSFMSQKLTKECLPEIYCILRYHQLAYLFGKSQKGAAASIDRFGVDTKVKSSVLRLLLQVVEIPELCSAISTAAAQPLLYLLLPLLSAVYEVSTSCCLCSFVMSCT
jgi:hypothetical protein